MVNQKKQISQGEKIRINLSLLPENQSFKKTYISLKF